MILKIRQAGERVLRQKARPLSRNEILNRSTQELIESMRETMHDAPGVGLAAPQVGESLRLIVVDVSGGEEDQKKQPYVLFNPVVLSSRGEAVAEEGCLSVPDVWADVTRPEIITVRALDREGKSFELKDVDGLLARCIQHEIDHLEGVLFVDKISSTDRLLNEAKLKRMVRLTR